MSLFNDDHLDFLTTLNHFSMDYSKSLTGLADQLKLLSITSGLKLGSCLLGGYWSEVSPVQPFLLNHAQITQTRIVRVSCSKAPTGKSSHIRVWTVNPSEGAKNPYLKTFEPQYKCHIPLSPIETITGNYLLLYDTLSCEAHWVCLVYEMWCLKVTDYTSRCECD